MAETSRTERTQMLADSQRQFLDEAVAASGLTLSQIARAAQMNPSTLTRFRNSEGHTSLLSAATLAAVAEITGVSPPVAAAAARRPKVLREEEAQPFVSAPDTREARLIAALTHGEPHLVAWEIKSRALELENIMPGDIVVVDLNATPKTGDIVCAQIYDWADHAKTQTVWRVFEAPFLLSASTDRSGKKPHIVDNETVVIKGVVREVLRPYRPAPFDPATKPTR